MIMYAIYNEKHPKEGDKPIAFLPDGHQAEDFIRYMRNGQHWIYPLEITIEADVAEYWGFPLGYTDE